MEIKKTFNVLAVSPTPTHRTVRGNRQRIFQVLKRLQDMGGVIHFLYMPREWDCKLDPVEMQMMKDQWDYVHLIAPNGFPPDAPSGEYHHIDEWYDEGIGHYANWLSWGIFFDIVMVNYAFFSKTFEVLNPNFLRVLDTHDQLAGRKELLLANGMQPEFFYTTEPEENKAFERSDVILAIKREEQVAFRTRTEKPVMKLGHTIKGLSTPHKPSNKKILIGYLGSDNSINKAGVTRFVTAFAPVLERLKGKVELHIAGLISDFAEVEFAHVKGLKVLGRVDSIEDFYRDIDLVVSPFDFGTGLKIKTVEAIAYGCAVAGTTHAFEGLETEEPQHLYHTCRDLAAGCAAILDSANPAAEIRRLQKVSSVMLETFHSEFEGVLGGLVSLSRRRRLVFVPVEDFHLEQTAAQKRSAIMIRELSDLFHVHVLYPYAIDALDRMRTAMQSWQWKNTVHLNETGMDPVAYVKSATAQLNPRLTISSLPVDDLGGDLFVADVQAANVQGWNRVWHKKARRPDRISYTCEQIWADLEHASDLYGMRRYCVGMLEYNRFIRPGSDILIQCTQPQDYAREIEICTQIAYLGTRDNRKVVLLSDGPYAGFSDEVVPLDKASSLNPQRFGLIVQMGSGSGAFSENRLAFASRGIPSIRLTQPNIEVALFGDAELQVSTETEFVAALTRTLLNEQTRSSRAQRALDASNVFNDVTTIHLMGKDLEALAMEGEAEEIQTLEAI